MESRPQPIDAPRRLAPFLVISYLLVVAVCWPFTTAAWSIGEGTHAFATLAGLTYPALYLLPAFVVLILARAGARSGWRRSVAAVVGVGAIASTVLLLVVDARVHEIYGFHLNGFVLNLVTTRGGLESMGVSPSAFAVGLLGAAALIGLVALAYRYSGAGGRAVGGRSYAGLGLGLLFLGWFGQQAWYGRCDLVGDVRVLTAARCFPLYLTTTFKGLAEDFGLEAVDVADSRFVLHEAPLNYPRRALEIEPPAQPYNVVWLVSESLRADALDARGMPNTTEFAAQNTRFTQHYSGGNGTRMGVFSMFYGLPAPYWFPMLDSQTGPVLMDALIAQGYQLGLFTSAHFTYPEFHKTVFANVPRELLHEANGGRGWERDRRNVYDLLEFMEQRDPARPFMSFLFFESPHARYYFPPESVIEEPYLEDFNYATMDLDDDIELIRARYQNSVHHLDEQFGRVIDYLERADLLDSTIVVITGDHGEEFMEQGRWGHGSSFVEEQVRVPLVLHLPGREPATVDRLTSHLDLPATLLPRLGVQNAPRDLSLGNDLFGPERRPYCLIGDWSSLCFVDPSYKLVFPVRMSAKLWADSSTRGDGPVPAGEDPVELRQEELLDVLSDLHWFQAGGSGARIAER